MKNWTLCETWHIVGEKLNRYITQKAGMGGTCRVAVSWGSISNLNNLSEKISFGQCQVTNYGKIRYTSSNSVTMKIPYVNTLTHSILYYENRYSQSFCNSIFSQNEWLLVYIYIVCAMLSFALNFYRYFS